MYKEYHDTLPWDDLEFDFRRIFSVKQLLDTYYILLPLYNLKSDLFSIYKVVWAYYTWFKNYLYTKASIIFSYI